MGKGMPNTKQRVEKLLAGRGYRVLGINIPSAEGAEPEGWSAVYAPAGVIGVAAWPCLRFAEAGTGADLHRVVSNDTAPPAAA